MVAGTGGPEGGPPDMLEHKVELRGLGGELVWGVSEEGLVRDRAQGFS